jgi:hypothetical protein
MKTSHDELIARLREAARPDRQGRRRCGPIVRLADALGWDVPEFDEFHARADAMLAGGYSLQ